MSDLDVFENRFLPVYRAYVTEIPTQVDAAAVARSVATTPTRPMVGWPGALRPAPALGWLVLFGLLMLATGAIAFVVGTNQHAIVPLPSPQPSPSASPSGSRCPPGSKPNEPGLAGQARPPESWSGTTVDWRIGRLILPTDGRIWTFDLCANTWHRSAATSNGGASVFDADSGLTVVIGAEGPVEGGASVTSYDAVSDTSRAMGPAPVQGFWQAVYDPVTGLILARDKRTSRMWTYDVDGDAWSEITQAGDTPPDNPPGPTGQGPLASFYSDIVAELLAYDSAADRLVLYVCRNGPFSQTYEFDPRTQQWTLQAIVTPVMYGGERSEIAYDAANERTVISGGGVVAAYDATAHLWHSDLVPDMVIYGGVAMAYDPVNERTVVVGDDLLHGEVLAIDLTHRQWVILLDHTGR